MTTIISHKFKFIFCHIPKSGGTSFTEYVRPHLGTADDISSFQKHERLMTIKNSRYDRIFNKYLKIAIIRDEEDRRASLDRVRIDQKETDEFYWRSDKWIRDNEGNILADVLIEFKNLATEAVDLLETLGVPRGEFPNIKAGKGLNK